MATGTNLFTSHEARILAHTPNNTTTFLRGDNTWSNILETSLNITKDNECGIEVNNTQTTNPHAGLFGVGSSGDLGIYDRTYSKWIVYSDSSGDVSLNGNATTATSTTRLARIGDNTEGTDTTVFSTNGLNVRWYSITGKIPEQPTQYGFLFTVGAGENSSENHQFWAEQSNGSIYHRGTNGSSYNSPPAFKTILDSGNYTSYTVTKTGSGASGSWGISVTGSSASCTGHAASDLALSGGTMTGVLTTSYKSGTWVNSLTSSAITLSDATGSYGGWICGPTKNGRIAISTYQSNDDLLYIGYGERGRTTNSFTRSMTWNGANGSLTTASFEATGNVYPSMRMTRSDSGETSIYWKNATAGWAAGIHCWSVGAGVFAIGQYAGTGSSAWRFKIDNSGYCYASSRLYNAVWNDFAEFREGTTEEPGRVVAATETSNKVSLTTERLQPVAHVISDTYGSSVGSSDIAKTPIGVSGRVLVYPYQDKNNYHVGDCLCAAPGGTADIMTREEIIRYPDRIIGIVDEIPQYEIWNASLSLTSEAKSETNIQVNGRIWIYVR